MELENEFSRRLSAKLTEKKWSEARLARELEVAGCGVTAFSVRSWLRGRSIPSVFRLCVIATLLRCRPGDLLPETMTLTETADV